MVSLTFYGGVNQIGGNKILLEGKETKIFLDFGMNFDEHGKFFTEYMPPRKCTCLRDMINLGFLPDMKGLYRRDYCKHMGLDKGGENSIDGVLITHAHMDHVGYVHHLRKDMPVYMSRETKAVADLFTRTGAGGFTEFSEVKPSFQLLPKKRGDGFKRRDARDGTEERNIKQFTYGKSFRIGEFEIVPCRVDHSLPGATAYIIHTDEGTIVYTGDLRFHGRHGEWTRDFVEKAEKSEPEVLLSEGTRIERKKSTTEEDVQRRSTEAIKGKNGLAIANFPIRDTDRLLTFYKTAVSNNRKLVIEVRQALLLDLLRDAGVDELPETTDENIRIFYPKKGWGLIGRNDFPPGQVKGDYKLAWEREYLDSKNIITAEEIGKNQENYVMFLNYFQLNNLLDIPLKKGSVHIRSMCEPFNEEMELDQKRIDNWLKFLNLYPEHKIHSSGHASGPDIFKMIKTIKPKKLFPIHTEHPEMFTSSRLNIPPGAIERNILPGKRYELFT